MSMRRSAEDKSLSSASDPEVLGNQSQDQITEESGVGFGVSQNITGFTNNEIAFMGVKEAIIQGTTSGLKQKNFLAAKEILDMMPGIVSGRIRVDSSKLEDALSFIEYGLSIGNGIDQIQKELEEAGLLESEECK